MRRWHRRLTLVKDRLVGGTSDVQLIFPGADYAQPSFPRKRESRSMHWTLPAELLSYARVNRDRVLKNSASLLVCFWIPACAGMTGAR